MNSEELEQSLKAEFETHLNSVAEEMKRELAQFHNLMLSEFDRHRSQIEEAIREFSSRAGGRTSLDQGFGELVSEHLKLARDEGAKLAATAYAEAESMAVPAVVADQSKGFESLRDAIDDISSKDSQSTILKSLLDHAGTFAPRGAFFIIKNEHFAGWKAFGEGLEEDAPRDIHFPVSNDTILSSARDARKLVVGEAYSRGADKEFLEPLGFGDPDKMYAIPLVARGRGVAVLYADAGPQGGSVNVEALETLVRVAGLTVELLAGAASQPQEEPAAQPVAEPVETAPEAVGQPETTSDFAISDSSSYDAELPAETPAEVDETPAEIAQLADSSVEEEHVAEAVEEEVPVEAASEEVPSFAKDDDLSDRTSFVPEPEPFQEPAREYDPQRDALVFDSDTAFDVVPEVVSPFESPVTPFEPASTIGGMSRAIEPTGAEVVSTVPVRSRLSDRNVDLPIEVPEDERRLHNDARRFARLLVSEIKLYNEKKVIEGRQAHDLYDRLKEAIDRSREMYDKRVQPPVAAKFDYFHYELLNSLADGDAQKFGNGYPGATI